MASATIPFYTQAAMLDSFIHTKDPGADQEAVQIIVEVLKRRDDLRAYFYRNRPDSAWLPILWDAGFFSAPPVPVQSEEGTRLPFWDAQNYLFSVAAEMPEYVLRHIATINAHPVYIAYAVHCLTQVSSETIERALPRIIDWLSDFETATYLADKTWPVLMKLTEDHRESAFTLFAALMRPFPNSGVKEINDYAYNSEAVSILDRYRYSDEKYRPILTSLRGDNAERLVGILEEHLIEALRIEVTTRSSDYPLSSWWRKAIEPSNQDSLRHFKDTLLNHLRDTLEQWSEIDSSSTSAVITRYLDGQEAILRRLGLHIIRLRPELLPDQTTRQLLDASNYQTTVIHHEFMRLLEDAFPSLNDSEQQLVLNIILSGPPHDRLTHMAERANKTYGEDVEEYVRGYTGHWILQRLWLIQNSLDAKISAILQQWVAELGPPDHPTFLSWTTGVYSVSDVSPLAAEQLAAYNPHELVEFLKQWQPDAHSFPGPQHISREGLAVALADVLVHNIANYQAAIVDLGSVHPQYTCTLLRQVVERAKNNYLTADEWKLYIDLAGSLLDNDDIRTGMERNSLVGWQDVRRNIIDLLEESVDKAHIDQVQPYLSCVRDLLIILLTDPDPCPEEELPAQGRNGSNDPITVALNHVRPAALTCLINYSHLIAIHSQSNAQEQGPGPDRLDPVVKHALEASLRDPSPAVHSVFGRNLSLLYWLDKIWVHAHLTAIFPQGTTDSDIMMWIASWEAYVFYNHTLYHDLSVALYPYYEQAIEHLKSGYTTNTHQRSAESLASHLILDYFWGTAANKYETLLHRFFDQLNAEYRGQAAWIFWQHCENSKESNKPHREWWPAARAFWQSRVDKASSQSFPSDFDREMSGFSQLLTIAPEEETILSLWPLLQGILPYVGGQGVRHMTWEAMETFLSTAVTLDPIRSIELYIQMHDRTPRVFWGVNDEAMQTIITQAVQEPKSRKQALALMDLLARRGDQRFRPLYERYA